MKCKIYASDEGYGPLIRQGAIINELLNIFPKLKIDFQTKQHASNINWIIESKINVIKKYNLISWAKNKNGSPNLEKIKKDYQYYLSQSKLFIDEELKGKVRFYYLRHCSRSIFNCKRNGHTIIWRMSFYMGLVFY